MREDIDIGDKANYKEKLIKSNSNKKNLNINNIISLIPE